MGLRLQPAVGEMQAILDSPARRQKLQTHLPWLEILALVLQHQSSGEARAGFPLLSKSSKLDETISEALRSVFGHICRQRVLSASLLLLKEFGELHLVPTTSLGNPCAHITLAIVMTFDEVAEGGICKATWASRIQTLLWFLSRVVWAGGAAAAVALSCSSVGAVLAEHLVDSNAGLWEAASTVLEAALSNQAHLTESIQALDAWSADTGRAESHCQLSSLSAT